MQYFGPNSDKLDNKTRNVRKEYELNKFSQFREQILPKLFYPNFEASVEIFRENAIGAEFNVLPQRENSQLDIMATAFDQDGIFLGQIFAKNDPFLQMCPSNGLFWLN